MLQFSALNMQRPACSARACMWGGRAGISDGAILRAQGLPRRPAGPCSLSNLSSSITAGTGAFPGLVGLARLGSSGRAPPPQPCMHAMHAGLTSTLTLT
jgi:hypothetical protein